MKRLLLVMVLVLLVACGGGEPETAVSTNNEQAGGSAVESSNSQSEAGAAGGSGEAKGDANLGGDAGDAQAPSPIAAGDYKASLGREDAIDAYTISSEPFELVQVTVQNPAENEVALVLSLTHLGVEDWTAEVAPDSSETVLVAANSQQTNLIQVRPATAVDGDVPYDLLVEVVPENDANTGGDVSGEVAEAVTIPAGVAIRGTSIRLDGVGGHDRDCYLVENVVGGVFRVEYESPADQPYAESYTALELYTATGEYVWGGSNEPGTVATLEAEVPDGDYVLCVSTYEYYPVGFYRVTVDPATVEAATTETGTPDEESVVAEETAVPEGGSGTDDTAASPAEGDSASCLIGSWRVANFEEYFISNVSAAAGEDIDLNISTSGDLVLSFDGETMTMSENNFQLVVTTYGQTVPVNIEAAGSARYTAADGVITNFVDGVNVNDTNSGLGVNLSSFAGKSVSYSCSGDSLRWTQEDGHEVVLERIN